MASPIGRRWTGVLFLAVCSAGPSGAQESRRPTRPNIVLMLVDNFGNGELGGYGGGL